VERSPLSPEAQIFRELASTVMKNDLKVVPTPINELPELEEMCCHHLTKK